MLSRIHRIVCALTCLMATLGIGGCGSGNGGGTKTIAVNISPVRAAVVALTQTVQFNATVAGDPTNSVTWSVDGVAGGNAAAGTISSGGLYTPPAGAGTHRVHATSTVDSTKSATATIAVTDLTGVVTYHNNLARDGTNTQEYALTTSSVKTASFGKVFSCTVDGAAYTQPLWVPGLSVSSVLRNAIFVATQHDSVYALDADVSPCSQLWHVNLLDAAHGGASGETPVPTGDVGSGFQDILPEIGVTGTPVIDLASGTLYVVSKSEGPAGSFHQRLHALDLITGDEKFAGPITIAASVPGTGDGSVSGILNFDPQNEHQRGALTLVNGTIYIAWAAHEDHDPYHGWVIGYDAATLAQVAVFNADPNGSRSGIWMSGRSSGRRRQRQSLFVHRQWHLRWKFRRPSEQRFWRHGDEGRNVVRPDAGRLVHALQSGLFGWTGRRSRFRRRSDFAGSAFGASTFVGRRRERRQALLAGP